MRKLNTKQLKELSSSFKHLFPEFPHWLQLQNGHDKVIRWEKYFSQHSLRKQTNSNHVVSVIHVATLICYKLKPLLPFDYGMVLGAFNVHEDGEALLRRDIVYNDKASDASGDVEEYKEFCKAHKEMENHDYVLFCKLQELFLLQFVTKPHKWHQFPPRAREILRKLERTKMLEASIFDAIERYEYILYCLEGEQIFTKLLAEVLGNQITFLDHYAVTIKGFGLIWTSEKSSLAANIIKEYTKRIKK